MEEGEDAISYMAHSKVLKVKNLRGDVWEESVPSDGMRFVKFTNGLSISLDRNFRIGANIDQMVVSVKWIGSSMPDR